MPIKIRGLKKLKRDIKKALRKIPLIAAVEYKKEIIKNLKPSKKTGALSKSWRIRASLRKATISSNLPYAAIQNFGGRIRITERMRGKMWALYKEFGLGVYKAIALTKKTHIVMPAKNYLDINEKTLMKKVDIKFNRITKKI